VTVRRADLVDGFQRLGIEPRATVLVHSAMRTLGYVEGGGDAVEWCVCDPTLLVV
jgi:aminoglycoside N3'-acetyltransferase